MAYSLTYVEIDIPVCSLTYGTSPCEAELGVTGTKKCFNSLKTCQDRVNFAESEVTLRFAMDTDYLPPSIECIPAILNVQVSGAQISLGRDLGIRASINVTLRDFQHSDRGAGFDKYVSDRGYDPYKQGTFWGKFRARQPYLRGRKLRLIRGLVGETIEQMETQHYIIESISGPDAGGTFQITAKDLLKLADDDRAKAPFANNGTLNADITNSETSITLIPAGIGNLEYPSSGYVAIAGKEIVSFTRSGDVMTITRAQMNTVAIAHKTNDRVQLVLQYTTEDPADIIYDLLTTYAGIDPSYLPLADWQAETAAYLQKVYSARIADPVGVNSLISELVEQAALALWWDSKAQQLKLQVLRAVPASATQLSEDNVDEASLEIQDQPELRLSQVWFYYAQRNPLEPLDRVDNYQSIHLEINAQAESDYGSAAIKSLFSRWVGSGGAAIAQRSSQILLARYSDPPRAFRMSLFRNQDVPEDEIVLGSSYNLRSWAIQDDEGAPSTAPIQVTRMMPLPDRYFIEAEELLFSGVELDDPNLHIITIDVNSNAVNLRTLHDSLYPEATSDTTVRCIINSGVRVGALTSNDPPPSNSQYPAHNRNHKTPALDIGTWASGVTIELINNGEIRGYGGSGGFTYESPSIPTHDIYGVSMKQGEQGGTAIYTRQAVTITNNGKIYGGGGGGSVNFGSDAFSIKYGGGGAGYPPGSVTKSFAPFAIIGSDMDHGGIVGTALAPNTANQNLTAGGNPGEAGVGLGAVPGGAAGAAVDGDSYVTWDTVGDVRGPQVN